MSKKLDYAGLIYFKEYCDKEYGDAIKPSRVGTTEDLYLAKDQFYIRANDFCEGLFDSDYSEGDFHIQNQPTTVSAATSHSDYLGKAKTYGGETLYFFSPKTGTDNFEPYWVDCELTVSEVISNTSGARQVYEVLDLSGRSSVDTAYFPDKVEYKSGSYYAKPGIEFTSLRIVAYLKGNDSSIYPDSLGFTIMFNSKNSAGKYNFVVLYAYDNYETYNMALVLQGGWVNTMQVNNNPYVYLNSKSVDASKLATVGMLSSVGSSTEDSNSSSNIILTLEEYNALSTKDPNAFYFIVD